MNSKPLTNDECLMEKSNNMLCSSHENNQCESESLGSFFEKSFFGKATRTPPDSSPALFQLFSSPPENSSGSESKHCFDKHMKEWEQNFRMPICSTSENPSTSKPQNNVDKHMNRWERNLKTQLCSSSEKSSSSNSQTQNHFDKHMNQWGQNLRTPLTAPSAGAGVELPYCYSKEYFNKHYAQSALNSGLSQHFLPFSNIKVDKRGQEALELYKRLSNQKKLHHNSLNLFFKKPEEQN